jgi:carbon monoxide dehydrogenase subunit G
MTRLEKTTTIYAPIETVFEFIDDPEKVAKYSAGVSRVKEVSKTEGRVGDVMRLTYSVLGMRYDEEFTYVEYKKPQLLVSKVTGHMAGMFHVTLEQEASNQTLVTLRAEYEIPSSSFSRALNKLVLERTNEKNLERTLANIKMMVENGWFSEGEKEKGTDRQETVVN